MRHHSAFCRIENHHRRVIYISRRANPGSHHDHQPDAGGLLASPQPIFDYLKARGATMEGEYVVIAGWPVQFLPAPTPLRPFAAA